jgi:two-component sensor histidine kinase
MGKILFWFFATAAFLFASVPTIDVSNITDKTKLQGEWAYEYGKLVPPTQTDSLSGKFVIPGKINKNDISYKGCATFAIDLKVTPNKPLSIDLRRPLTAWKIFVDDKLLAESGVIDTNSSTYIASMTRGAFSFTPQTNKVRITVWLANSQHEYFGISDTPIIAPSGMLEKARASLVKAEIFIIGILFAAGIYHIGLFVLYRKEKTPLWFGIFCLLLAIRTSTTGAKVITDAFENISWEAVTRVEYLSGYALLSMFVFYVGSLYERQSNKKIEYAFLALSVLYLLFVIFGSTVFFTATLYSYEIIVLAFISFVTWLLYRSYRAKEQSSIFALVAFFVFALTIVHDLLMFNKVIDDNKDLFPFGFLLYLGAQAAILMRRYANAFHRLERHGEELENTVNERTKELQNMVKQRELLFRELSHRVKNNLQFIIGLLWLKQSSSDKKTNETLSSLQSQIQAIATVHETLCVQPDIAVLECGKYINSIVGSLAEIYKNVDFECDINGAANVTVDEAISVGLIINELAINSIKHSIGDGSGTIYVFFEAKNGDMVIKYTDRTSVFDIKLFNTRSSDKKSIGWSMIQELFGELKADVSIDDKYLIINFQSGSKA